VNVAVSADLFYDSVFLRFPRVETHPGKCEHCFSLRFRWITPLRQILAFAPKAKLLASRFSDFNTPVADVLL